MNEKTKVIFRTDKEGIMFALFPEDKPDLLAELVTLVGRCHELEKIFPEQAGMLRAMTQEAREAIAKSVQTEKSGAD